MARAPRPSEVRKREERAAKAKKPSGKKAAKKAAASAANGNEPRKPKHGGKVITKEDIAAAESLMNVPSTIRLPSTSYIRDFFMKTLPALDKEKDARVKDIRDAHADAAEHHMDKAATAIVRKLVKMPDSKLQVTMYHMANCIRALGLWERALKQGQLDLERVERARSGGGGDSEGGEKADDGSADAPAMTIVDAPGTEADDPEPTLADAMGEAMTADGAHADTGYRH